MHTHLNNDKCFDTSTDMAEQSINKINALPTKLIMVTLCTTNTHEI